MAGPGTSDPNGDPSGGGPVGPVGNPCDGQEQSEGAIAAQTLIDNLSISDGNQASFLHSNEDVSTAMHGFLNTQMWSPDNKDFVRWAIAYLNDHRNVDYNVFFATNEFSGINNLPNNAAEEPLIQNGITESAIPSGVNFATSRLIAKTQDRNNTEDMTYGMNGNTNGILSSRLQASELQLFDDMTELFQFCTKGSLTLRAVGLDMINRFKNNTGITYEHLDLNKMVEESNTFTNFVRKFGNLLKLKLQNTNGDINNISTIEIDPDERPKFNGLSNLVRGFQILINDTEYTEVQLLNYQINPTTQEWIADVRFIIKDHFGLDKNDALRYQGKHRGFASWWVLQHKKSHRPFETKVTVERRIYGSL